MDEIPGWIIAVLFLAYGAEYIYRAFTVKDRKYIYIGKAGGRLLMSIVYFYFVAVPTPADVRAYWIRYGLLMFLLVDLFFVAQEHLMRRYIR